MVEKPAIEFDFDKAKVLENEIVKSLGSLNDTLNRIQTQRVESVRGWWGGGSEESFIRNFITAKKQVSKGLDNWLKEYKKLIQDVVKAKQEQERALITQLKVLPDTGYVSGVTAGMWGNANDNPSTGLEPDPRNPRSDPWLGEKLLWDDIGGSDLTYIEKCKLLSERYGDLNDADRKAFANELAELYSGAPEIVKSINAFGDGAFQLPVVPVEGGVLGEGWPTYSDNTYHGGIDIKAPKGTPIVSATSGTVKVAGYDANYGNYVVIELHDGSWIYYAHMVDAPSVKKDDMLKPGDHIGNVGSTGNSTGNHLHVEVREGPDHLWGSSANPNSDPTNYIPGLT